MATMSSSVPEGTTLKAGRKNRDEKKAEPSNGNHKHLTFLIRVILDVMRSRPDGTVAERARGPFAFTSAHDRTSGPYLRSRDPNKLHSRFSISSTPMGPTADSERAILLQTFVLFLGFTT